MRAALGVSQTVRHLVRVYTKYEAHNVLLRRKMDMLMHKPWREQVLKELGGLHKLKLWEATRKRIEARNEARRNGPAPETPLAPSPTWLYTPERIAESEKLKARVRMCQRATASPNIFRDRFRVDFEGEFRLAPLPRGPQVTRQIVVYTAETISDYDWNAMRLEPITGPGPAIVWPAEFYAAMKAEAMLEETSNSVIRHKPLAAQMGDQAKQNSSLTLDPPSSGKALLRDDKEEIGLPTVSAEEVMFEKDHRRIFGERTLGDQTA